MGRGRRQPAARREGIIGTSTCDGEGEGTGREGIIRTGTCDGVGQGVREGGKGVREID